MTENKNVFCVDYERIKEWIFDGNEKQMKKYGFDEDECIEGEYEYLEDERPCYNKVKFYIPFQYKGKDNELSKVVSFNTSSPFALFMCDLDEYNRQQEESDEEQDD